MRYPEKKSPGKYDLWVFFIKISNKGNSHNIWHLCVISANLFTYFASHRLLNERIKITYDN